MRFDAPTLVFLSQTVQEHVDGLARAPWWFFAFLALIGGTAGIAKLWAVVGEYVKDKREAAKALAAEEKARRDAKTKAEVEQSEALTAMARDVPRQFELMGKRHDDFAAKLVESNRVLAEHVLATKQSQDELRKEIHDDTRALVLAIAGKVGVQPEDAPTARRSSPDQEPKVRHVSPGSHPVAVASL